MAYDETGTDWIDWESAQPIDSPPPSKTLDWIESELESPILDVLPLPGGLSSAVHRLELLDGRAVVVRRYVLADWLEREPDIPADEARVLGLLPTIGLPVATPSLVLADTEANQADVPTIVMSEVRGRPFLNPVDRGQWADELARVLASIHGVAVDQVEDTVGLWRRWDDPDRPIPSWTERPELWKEAKKLVPSELRVDQPTFLHRDFHPNNIHWIDDEVVGVVDWLGACVGEPAADLAHCRWNLAVLHDAEVAGWFTSTYRSLTGYEGDLLPYDLSTVLSGPVGPFPTYPWNALGRHDLTPEVVAGRIDTWLAQLLED